MNQTRNIPASSHPLFRQTVPRIAVERWLFGLGAVTAGLIILLVAMSMMDHARDRTLALEIAALGLVFAIGSIAAGWRYRSRRLSVRRLLPDLRYTMNGRTDAGPSPFTRNRNRKHRPVISSLIRILAVMMAIAGLLMTCTIIWGS